MTELALRLVNAHAASRSWLRRLRTFIGPGFLIAVGYMDPGNWATDMAAGSALGYSLLWVVLAANIAALFMQYLSAKLGVVTGHDLAQLCRMRSSRAVNLINWIGCELAICACDLAEVIGSAIALNLLFRLPVLYGVVLTVADALLVLWLTQRDMKRLEKLVYVLVGTVAFAFLGELILARPDWLAVAGGAVPSLTPLGTSTGMLLAVGIVGATVMPHNLYLHSSIVRGPKSENARGRATRLGFVTWDLILALMLAFAVNASMLILAASAFHENGITHIATLEDAHRLLQPLLGSALAPILFGVALLAAGQSATLTATLAGQTIMQGFLGWQVSAALRRVLTRLIAIVPALLAVLFFGEQALGRLLILSQVALSLQLPFAIAPLVRFTSNKQLMGAQVNATWLSVLAWLIVGCVVAGNAVVLWQM